MLEYIFKTKPFSHQRRIFAESAELEYFGVFWEQGTGKTKLVLDTVAYNYQQTRVDALLVKAPNGVHDNWVREEIPTHLPDSIPVMCLTWHSDKADRVYTREAYKELVNFKGLAVLAMPYDSLQTKAGFEVCKHFAKRRKCFGAADESAHIKTPSATRTRRSLVISKLMVMRRVLTGTPVANSPFDVFSQLKYLSEEIWKEHGLGSFTIFKKHFGVYIKKTLRELVIGRNGEPVKGPDGRPLHRQYDDLVEYQRLDQLKAIVDKVSSRVLKEDVLDLPPKLYSKRFFDISPEARRAYKELKRELIIYLDGGHIVEAPLAIIMMMKLQQISNGFVITTEEGSYSLFDSVLESNILDLGEKNPRIEALVDVVNEAQGKVIVWARFTHDIHLIMARLGKEEIDAVSYFGETSTDDRTLAIAKFQKDKDGPCKVFVANPACAGEGLTLHAATTVIYYSNSFKLTERLQSEDRAHRIGQEHPVLYVDLVAKDTLDEKIVRALRDKRDIASLITGDNLGEWI